MKKQVIAVVGPTASGKTALSIFLAQKMNGEVISADSMQVYRGMDIGTAKPSLKERMGISHHMLDIVNPDEEYSVALFQKQAKNCIEDILHRGKLPIIVGGTGLYINALTHDLDFTQTPHHPHLRERLNKIPAQQLYMKLCSLDLTTAARIHPNNKKRIIRAIEIIKGSQSQRRIYDFDRQNNFYDYRIIGLSCERERLYQRINHRTDVMIERGLLQEAENLLQRYGGQLISMQAIGYKEWIPYFAGTVDLKHTIEKIKQNTRRYAKRQLTWFRRDDRIRWYDTAISLETILSEVNCFIKEKSSGES
jgi:tRNA dimethylallyltransferase